MAQYDNAFQTRLHAKWAKTRERTLRALYDAGVGMHVLDQTKEQARLAKLYTKLAECGRHAAIYQRAEDGQLVQSTARCKSRICPRCSTIRAERVRESIAAAAKEINSPRFVTLTLKHSDRTLDDQLKELRESFTRLRRQKAWKARVTGAIAIIEVKWGNADKRWHPHLHVITDGVYWPQAGLSKAWERASNGSSIVDIRAIHDRKQVAKYVAKYVTDCSKNERMPLEKLPEFALAMHGVRLISSTGKMHGRVKEHERHEQNGTLEHVMPLGPLADDADHGDRRAARLLRAFDLGRRLQTDPITDELTPRDSDRCRKITRRLRSRVNGWKTYSGSDPPEEPDVKSKPGHSGDRSLRLWEDDRRPESVFLHA